MSNRVPGAISAASNFEMLVRKPFDARQVVPSYTALTSAANWTNASDAKTNPGKINAYNGLIVAVVDTSDTSHNGIYYLFDAACTSALKSPDVTNSDNWHKVANLTDVTSNSGSIDEEAVNALIQTQIDALKAELEAANYLTEEDLADYATKDEVEDAIEENRITADKIREVNSVKDLEAVGDGNYFYVAKDTGLTYIYDPEDVTYKEFAINQYYVQVIDGGNASSIFEN